MSRAGLRGRGWLHPTILSAAGLACASGFAQFGVTAALGDIAEAFGEPAPEGSVAAEVGMTATTLGIGLAIIRLASIGSLPAAAVADRFGRRRVLLGACAAGLAFTALASLSPSFWWFVAILALGRPLLSATNAVAAVISAEQTTSADRSKAIALVGAAYAVGSGIVAIVRGVAAEQLGFQGVFALALVPLALLPLLGRYLKESDLYRATERDPERRPRLPNRVPRKLLGRLVLVCVLGFGMGFVTGPANTYLFVYAENVLGVDPAVMAVLVVGAGIFGLGGLLVGRWAADRIGRRPTAGLGMAATAGASLLTYSSAAEGMAAGYLLSTTAAAMFGPAAGALDTEIFPTSVRATAAGWLTAMGVLGAVSGLAVYGGLVDLLQGFAPAAAAVAIPVMLLSTLYTLLPETRGQELEQSAPEPTRV